MARTLRRLAVIVLTALAALALAAPALAAQTGDLTISGATDGKHYDVYKVLDLTQNGDAYSYTVNDNFKDFTSQAMGEDDLVTYLGKQSNNTTAISNLAKELVAYAIQHKVPIAGTGDASGGSATISGLEYGYYVMNPRGAEKASGTYASMFSLGTLSGGNTTITVKAEYPTPDKKIVENDAEVVVNEASIGEDVTYRIKAKVPDLTGYKWFEMSAVDHLDKGLKYKGIESIKVNGTELVSDKTAADGANYKIDAGTYDKATGQDVTFTIKDLMEVSGAKAGDDIVVEYKATVTENAVIGKDPNNNTVKLTYSNDPKWQQDKEKGSSGEPKGESGEIKTETYVTQLTVLKVDGTDKPLKGAEFTLTGDGVKTVITSGTFYTLDANGVYYKLKDGTFTTTAPSNDTEAKYESTTDKYKRETKQVLDTSVDGVNAKAYVDEATGKVTFTGLGAGTYTLSETVVPNGYNQISDIEFTVTFDPATKKFNSTSPITVDADNNVLETKVINTSGNVLPTTGGMGTTVLYAVGGMLVLCAGVALVAKRRMGSLEA